MARDQPTSSEGSRNLTATVVRGISLASGGYSLSLGFTFAAYLALARLATPKDFGKFAAGSILIGVGSLFVESGMLAALVQRRDRMEEAASTAFAATVLGGVGASVIALALSPLVGLFFRNPSIGVVAAAMSGTFVLRQSIIVPNALMQRRFSFVRRAVLDPAAACAFGVTAVIACAHGMGVWGLVTGTYASILVEVILSWSLAGWRPQLHRSSFGMWRELIRFGRHVIGAEFVSRTTMEMSTAFVGRFLGAPALGQFQYAARIAARPLGAFVNTTSYVLFPAFARISDDQLRFRRAFLRSLRWMCVVMFPASLMLFALGKPFVVVLFGERWREAGSALMAMCLYPAGHSFDSLGSETFKAAGRPNLLLRMHVAGLILTAAFMIVLLPFGLLGLAAALSLRSVGVAVYALRASGRVIGIPIRLILDEAWPPAVAAVALVGVVFPIEHFVVHAESHQTIIALALLVAEGTLGVAVYLGALTMTAPATTRSLLHAVQQARLARRRPASHTEPSAGVEAPVQ
jgi:PST family polysaccharide transporter